MLLAVLPTTTLLTFDGAYDLELTYSRKFEFVSIAILLNTLDDSEALAFQIKAPNLLLLKVVEDIVVTVDGSDT